MVSISNYPMPQMNQTASEIKQVLKLTLESTQFEQFLSEWDKNLDHLSTLHSNFIEKVKEKENWATEEFLNQLLSLRESIPSSTSVPFLLKQSQNHNDQTYYVSCLAMSIGMLKSDDSVLTKYDNTKFSCSNLEKTQQSNMFSCRIPGKTKDTIYGDEKSKHVLVLFKGCAFVVYILSSNGETLNFSEIYAQIKAITNYDGKITPSICKFTSLKRDKWNEIRENLLEKNKESLKLMESSIATIIIEDKDCPSEYHEAIDHVKFGDALHGNMRYYDQIVNIIVYKNCVAGLLLEHTVVDGYLMYVICQSLYYMGENCGVKITIKKSGDEIKFNLNPISFNLNDITFENSLCVSTNIEYFDFFGYEDMFAILKEQRLYEAWINFSLQLAIKQTFGTLKFLLVTPTHVRHFNNGRSDPTYTITEKSVKFLDELSSNQSSYEIINTFVEAVKEHKNKIKSSKMGYAIGPHIGQLRNWLSNDGNLLKKLMEIFGSPSIYLTGYESAKEIDFAISNLYATNQLHVSYFGSENKVRVIMNVNGIFKEKIKDLKNNFLKAMFDIQTVATKTAIAIQMNALETLKNCEKQNEKLPFSILLHGGAGANMNLGKEIEEVVLFSLKAALSVGICSLKSGESAVDAVEKIVTSLENCFLFNAGKGSIYNEKNEHELEASIVDGKNKICGSVACLTTIKNPIKAARIVMEKTPHSFVVGKKVEDIAKEFNLPTVENTYFDTSFRRREMSNNTFKSYDHKQTVGALALDIYGNIAAASSTGGTMKKMRGRISDTAIVGAGIYSDEHVAVACSGNGEVFIRNSIASKIASCYKINKSLRDSCEKVLNKELGSNFGGVIALSSDGSFHVENCSESMFIGLYDGLNSRVEILDKKSLEAVSSKVNIESLDIIPPKSWQSPILHSETAITHEWYSAIFDIQNTLYHSTVNFFNNLKYYYVLTPITTQTISSPMGLGSDSEPVQVKISGENVFIADSMQFVLEYSLRLKKNLAGTYYISPSFRGETPDSTHLNQFYHVECEILGDMDAAISIAEKYVINLTKKICKKHSSIIQRTAGSISHINTILETFEKEGKFPRIELDDAIDIMKDFHDFYELVVNGRPEFGRKLTRKGEQFLIQKFKGPVWLTHMDHLGVPFYQGYSNAEKTKAKAADLLIGLGETLGLGERHETCIQAEEALAHHRIEKEDYNWYLNMRRIKPLLTSGWGMGTERFLCWILQNDDVRDMQILPRLNGFQFLP